MHVDGRSIKPAEGATLRWLGGIALWKTFNLSILFGQAYSFSEQWRFENHMIPFGWKMALKQCT